MRLRFTLLLCALCLSRSSAAQMEVITVPLIDKTGAASPFQVSGRLLLQEAVHGNQLEWSWGQKVAVKNVSGKPVLLFVATLTEIGRHPKGQHTAPGDGPTYLPRGRQVLQREPSSAGRIADAPRHRAGIPRRSMLHQPIGREQRSDRGVLFALRTVRRRLNLRRSSRGTRRPRNAGDDPPWLARPDSVLRRTWRAGLCRQAKRTVPLFGNRALQADTHEIQRGRNPAGAR